MALAQLGDGPGIDLGIEHHDRLDPVLRIGLPGEGRQRATQDIGHRPRHRVVASGDGLDDDRDER
jgi:hypothetical protein